MERICGHCRKTEDELQKEFWACGFCVDYHSKKTNICYYHPQNWELNVQFYCSKECQIKDWKYHYYKCSKKSECIQCLNF